MRHYQAFRDAADNAGITGSAMVGIIGLLVSEAMGEAKAMSQEEWDVRDAANLPHYFASAIFYTVQNRFRDAP